MFVVKVNNSMDYQAACAILAQHDVFVKIDFTKDDKALIVVGPKLNTPEGMVPAQSDIEEAEYTLKMCEMHFQNLFLQGGNLCPVCRAEIERTGEGSSVCGHLTFTTTI
ncbi:MAG: hypothetical protein ACQ5SW_07790 [Sphaerochaetaceae bacterium]